MLIPKHTDSNGWWSVLPAPAPARRLIGNHQVGTAVVGAGVCGLAVARRLAELRPDEQILLVEAERAGFGASGRNAGFMLDLHSHGEPKALSVLKRNMKLWAAGLDDLRRLVREYQIRCDWSEWGRLYGSAGADGEKHIDELARTLDALGMPYEWRGGQDMSDMLGTGFYRRGLHAPGSALVNPAALMRGLADTLPPGVTLYEESPVNEIRRGGSGFELKTSEGAVTADRVVLAAGVFLQQFGVGKNRYVPMATYASLSEPLSDKQAETFAAGAEFGLLASSENGATIRLTRDGRLFFRNYFNFVPGRMPTADEVAGISQMHREGITKRWPQLSDLRIEHAWGGTMAFTSNNGSIFGEIEPGLFAVLTHDVSPMTRGTASGRLLADLMEGRDSELLRLALDIPAAGRLPPRPLLDIGVAWKLRSIRRLGAEEF